MELSKKVQSMHLSPIRKFNGYAIDARAKGIKVYNLNIGQPDIKTPVEFMQAVKSFDNEVLAYSESVGLRELQENVVKYYKRFGVELQNHHVQITNGGSEALNMAYTCILNPGDEVLVAEPFYTNYHTFITAAEGRIVPITTKAEESYNYAFRDRIEAKITKNTKALSIVNPENPTGYVLTKKEMRMIADVVKENDLWLVVDEVYREFVYDGLPMTTFLEFDDIKDRLIIIDSISKRFSACGARVGMLISRNDDLMESALKLAQGRLCPATLDMLGAKALYDLKPSYFDDIKKEYEERRNAAYEEVMKIDGAVCAMPKGAFYMMVKLPVEDAEKFLVWLLTEFTDNNETVMYAPMKSFYATNTLGKSEIRLAYVLKKKDLVRSIELIRLGIEKYKALGNR
ncbi:MAG: pyridoxal phosphate-dependent aminotransferase [Eubacteriales bacterium]